MTALPAPPPQSRNVVLIVWDTVRAGSLGLYGYPRDTTPNLARWARRGVAYRSAVAPAPWTYPSLSCAFTGQWPLEINTQWNSTLDTPAPTLAEYLASRGYQTAGFVANTDSCTYESGLDRGFAHFEDYTTTPLSVLARTVPGKWIVTRVAGLVGAYHAEKWLALQSRDASELNGAFVDWLDRRRPDRPFFAFLNDYDAHEPYVPPPRFAGRFGIRPEGRKDHRFLLDYEGEAKNTAPMRDIFMAHDCYDDCIAYLDDQLGRLLRELGRRKLLDATDVIIASDHGEAFAEHGVLGHAFSVHVEEVGVPLVILSPGAPAGRVIFRPVSLRDLPATVVDRLGLSDRSPFPGRSLAADWIVGSGTVPSASTTPAFSEQADSTAFRARPGPGETISRYEMSIVSSTYHYIRDALGREQLYDLASDPSERANLVASAGRKDLVAGLRAALLEMLTENPGSAEVERAYLKRYKDSLEAQVREATPDLTTWRGAFRD